MIGVPPYLWKTPLLPGKTPTGTKFTGVGGGNSSISPRRKGVLSVIPRLIPPGPVTGSRHTRHRDTILALPSLSEDRPSILEKAGEHAEVTELPHVQDPVEAEGGVVVKEEELQKIVDTHLSLFHSLPLVKGHLR